MTVATTGDLAGQFLLDPTITFLNHGSFGACPAPVFAEYQRLQLELERRPVEWLARRNEALMGEARTRLAAYVGAEPDEVVYFPNPTTAINMVARSLDLRPGDEIVTTDHEYGAMNRTWRVICAAAGARYVQVPIPLPVVSADDIVERVWAAVTERTRVLFISHITSATALRFPVEELCRRARAAGLLSIVDGAHVPGQLPLHLTALGADIYTGACHKWLCAPKGSAFLYARPDQQHWLRPLVVSWGWESEAPSASTFVDHHEWQGTRDPAAFLATPAAIDFEAAHDWPSVQRTCHELVREARRRIHRLTGLEPVCPDAPEWFAQMATIPLPDVDVTELKRRLYDVHHIEIPVHRWSGRPLLRISCQAYNTMADVDALEAALATELPALTGFSVAG